MGTIIKLTNVEDDNDIIRVNSSQIIYYYRHKSENSKGRSILFLTNGNCLIVQETVNEIDDMLGVK